MRDFVVGAAPVFLPRTCRSALAGAFVSFGHEQLIQRTKNRIVAVARDLEGTALRLLRERRILGGLHLDPTLVAGRRTGDRDDVAVRQREDAPAAAWLKSMSLAAATSSAVRPLRRLTRGRECLAASSALRPAGVPSSAKSVLLGLSRCSGICRHPSRGLISTLLNRGCDGMSMSRVSIQERGSASTEIAGSTA